MSGLVNKSEKVSFSIEETDLLLRILNDTDFKGAQVKLASKLMEKVIKIHTNLMSYKAHI
jgi:hypothetical protein|tara:strand:- start:3461 stop:3640 length:180 start_codon:yes stop_codon:yes gene_type:complete